MNAPTGIMRPYLSVLLVLPLLCGCVQEMADQPRVETWETSSTTSHKDNRRAPVEGTVARGQLQLDEHLYEGMQNGDPAETFPFAIDADKLARGRERFEIYCVPCHGMAGDGDGPVVQRGFPRPPTYHSQRLRNAPPGHLFDVISGGLGRMPRFSDRIAVRDRWAIAAYIRALQLSQNVQLEELSEQDRTEILDEL